MAWNGQVGATRGRGYPDCIWFERHRPGIGAKRTSGRGGVGPRSTRSCLDGCCPPHGTLQVNLP